MRGMFALFLCVGIAAATSARAEDRIGDTITAKNQVTAKLGVILRPLATGDGVSASETVRTGPSSAAVLRFLDNTNLNIGASSTVLLDSFVYNPDSSTKTAVLNLTKGAMRFVTGKSDPANFVIKTQVATLGIRGTDFVVLNNGDSTSSVVVNRGLVSVCPHDRAKFDETCQDGYQLDVKHNATTIGANGKNSGPQTLPAATVAQLLNALDSGTNLKLGNLVIGVPQIFPTTPRSSSPH